MILCCIIFRNVESYYVNNSKWIMPPVIHVPVSSSVVTKGYLMWLDLASGSITNMNTNMNMCLHMVVSLLNPRLPKIVCFISQVEENQGPLFGNTSQLPACGPLVSTSLQLTCQLIASAWMSQVNIAWRKDILLQLSFA